MTPSPDLVEKVARAIADEDWHSEPGRSVWDELADTYAEWDAAIKAENRKVLGPPKEDYIKQARSAIAALPTGWRDDVIEECAKVVEEFDNSHNEGHPGLASAIARGIRALKSAAPQSGWRDIASAPKDKTMIALLHFDAGYSRYGVGWYMPMNGWQAWGSDLEPTHWCPLPAAPQVKEEPT